MLISGSHIQFSLRNLNITAKSVKGGWKYELKGEITEEDYAQFQGSDFTGSLFEVHDMECVEVTTIKPKGGALSKNAAMLRQDQNFIRYVNEKMGFDDVKEYMYLVCSVQSLAELDHNAEAKKAYESMRRAFHDWENPL